MIENWRNYWISSQFYIYGSPFRLLVLSHQLYNIKWKVTKNQAGKIYSNFRSWTYPSPLRCNVSRSWRKPSLNSTGNLSTGLHIWSREVKSFFFIFIKFESTCKFSELALCFIWWIISITFNYHPSSHD